MLITYTLLVSFLLLGAHLLLFPFLKRRPVFIKGIEGSLLSGVFLAAIASLSHPLIYFIAIATGFLIYYTKSWIVYGVSLENINNALRKAILATRSSSVEITKGYEIDNNMTIKLSNLGIRICFIQYQSKVISRKSELTKEIFRKFMQNYFI